MSSRAERSKPLKIIRIYQHTNLPKKHLLNLLQLFLKLAIITSHLTEIQTINTIKMLSSVLSFTVRIIRYCFYGYQNHGVN
jgi:type III secretory pathway lipoprotein EscJ